MRAVEQAAAVSPSIAVDILHRAVLQAVDELPKRKVRIRPDDPEAVARAVEAAFVAGREMDVEYLDED